MKSSREHIIIIVATCALIEKTVFLLQWTECLMVFKKVKFLQALLPSLFFTNPHHILTEFIHMYIHTSTLFIRDE